MPQEASPVALRQGWEAGTLAPSERTRQHHLGSHLASASPRERGALGGVGGTDV